MNKIYLLLLTVISTFLLSSDFFDESNPIGLATKNEMSTWESKYPKSLGIGFGTSTAINNNLLNYSERGQSSNKWILINYKNFYNFNFKNKEINISLLAGTENFYLINNFNLWGIFSLQFFDFINLGVGSGINVVLHQFQYEETALGIIFDINTPLPLNFKNMYYTMGINFKHIFTQFNNIELLGSYNSQIINFYIDFELPTKFLPIILN